MRSLGLGLLAVAVSGCAGSRDDDAPKVSLVGPDGAETCERLMPSALVTKALGTEVRAIEASSEMSAGRPVARCAWESTVPADPRRASLWMQCGVDIRLGPDDYATAILNDRGTVFGQVRGGEWRGYANWEVQGVNEPSGCRLRLQVSGTEQSTLIQLAGELAASLRPRTSAS